MNIRFLNSALAAAFVAGLHTHAPDDVNIELNFGLDELPLRGNHCILAVDSEVADRTIEVGLTDDAYTSSVVNVHGLNAAVDHILRPFAATQQQVVVTLANGYEAEVRRDRVNVGCKNFAAVDMERINIAAVRASKGLRFASFPTSTGHLIRKAGTEAVIQVDTERGVLATDVLKVVAAFNQLQGQPAAAQFVPFNLLA